MVTVSGIPIGITTTFILGIAISGFDCAAVLIVVITNLVLFKKQMNQIKENNKNTKTPKEKVGPIDKIKNKNKNKKEETKNSDIHPDKN